MFRYLSDGRDATAPQENSAGSGTFHHDDVMVKVLDISPESCATKEARNALVQEARAALSKGQAVAFVGWKPDPTMEWAWAEEDFANLTGGISPEGPPSLEKEVQWQCTYDSCPPNALVHTRSCSFSVAQTPARG